MIFRTTKLVIIGILITTAVPSTSQNGQGQLAVRVTKLNTSDGISNVSLSIQGPFAIVDPESVFQIYTPNPDLTPEMRVQIDELIRTAAAGISADGLISAEAVAEAAQKLESQLLGTPPPPPRAHNPVPTNRLLRGETNGVGTFTFSNLPAGRYLIRAQRQGWFGTLPSGSLAVSLPTTASTVATVMSVDLTSINLPMVQAATISGRVRSPSGQPLSGVPVGASKLSYQYSGVLLNLFNSVNTDDRGEFRIFGLVPGEYFISVTPRAATASVATQNSSMAKTYYPSTSRIESASSIMVGEGQDITDINIGVREDAASILGHFTLPQSDLFGQTGRPFSFFLLPIDTKAILDPANFTPDKVVTNINDGSFEIYGVSPGSYELIATRQKGLGTAFGRARVDIASGAVGDVAVNFKPGFQLKANLTVETENIPYRMSAPTVVRGVSALSGIDGRPVLIASTATLTDAPPIPTPSYKLVLRSSELYPTPFDIAAQQQVLFEPPGSFQFSDVPEGRFRISVTGVPSHFYIVDVRSGDRSIFDEGFVTSEVTRTIEVTLSSKGAQINGIVREADKKLFPSARVVLIPEPTRRRNIALYHTALSDSQGHFGLTGVAPGRYKLFAWPSLSGTPYMNEVFMKQYELQGLPLTVKQGETVSSDLTVISK